MFKDNIWGVDLAEMKLISKYNKGIRYLLCAIYLFSEYAWVVSLKDKKGVTIANAFQSILDKYFNKATSIIHKFFHMNLCMDLWKNYRKYA